MYGAPENGTLSHAAIPNHIIIPNLFYTEIQLAHWRALLLPCSLYTDPWWQPVKNVSLGSPKNRGP